MEKKRSAVSSFGLAAWRRCRLATARLAMGFTPVALATTLAAGITTSKASAQEAVDIGVLLPMSGIGASYGEQALNGMRIALDEVIASGGVLGGKKINFIIEDSESQPQAAMDAVHKLIDVDDVPIVLGEISSGRTIPTATYANSRDVVQIGLASTSPDLRQVGPYFFSMLATDEIMGKAMVDYAYKNSGKDDFGIIVMNDPYGVGIAEEMRAVIEAMGGTVVSEVRYELNKTDYRAEVQRLFRSNPSNVLSVAWSEVARLIQKQAWELGYAQDANKNWYSAYFADSVDECVPETCEGRKGLDITTSDGPRVDSLKEKYAARYGEDKNLTWYVTIGYDAVWVVAKALDAAGSTDPEAIREALPGVFASYEGVSDKDLTVDDDGIQTNQNFGVFSYVNGDIVRVR